MITIEDSEISPAEVTAYKGRLLDDQAREKHIKPIRANNPAVVHLFTDEIPATPASNWLMQGKASLSASTTSHSALWWSSADDLLGT